jgi:hypothetical protein
MAWFLPRARNLRQFAFVHLWTKRKIHLQFSPNNQCRADSEEINRHQRIILVAEAFDYSVLVGAEWLTEQFGVGILCCRLSIAKAAAGNGEFLFCSNIFPAPELAQQAVRRGRGRSGVSPSKWSDWNAALAKVNNPALVAYYQKELEAGRENYLRRLRGGSR